MRYVLIDKINLMISDSVVGGAKPLQQEIIAHPFRNILVYTVIVNY